MPTCNLRCLPAQLLKHRRCFRSPIVIDVDHAPIQRGKRGPDIPALINHKAIEILRNTGPEPLEITKLTSPHSMAFRWRADGGPTLNADL